MRIRVTFRDRKLISYLPINTNYYLAYLIKSLIKNYQQFLISLLPEKSQSNNTFDCFTFSQLIIPCRRIEGKKLAIYSAEFCWYVSSPFHQFIGLLANELQQRKWVKLANNYYEIRQIEFLRRPRFFSKSNYFTCLSPITIVKNSATELNGRLTIGNFLLPDDCEFQLRIKEDIIRKYKYITGNIISDVKFGIEIDKNYLEKKKNKISKLIAFEKNLNRPEFLRGFLAPFIIKTEPEVLKIIYDVGLGGYNQMGFGMIKMIFDQYSSQGEVPLI